VANQMQASRLRMTDADWGTVVVASSLSLSLLEGGGERLNTDWSIVRA
jgi:hypothetical protein